MLHKEFTPTLRSLRRDFNAVATNLRLVEGVDAGEHLALEELEGGAAAGGDVRHLVGEAGLLNRREGVGADDVGGGEELDALLLSLLHELLGELNLVVLDEGGTDVLAQRLVKGEDHAAAEDNLVSLVEKGLDDANLGRHLGATDYGAERAVGVGHRAVEVVELLLEKETGHGRGEKLGDARGGRVRAVRGAERVVDVEVGKLGELLGEVLAVLLLVLVEADVLEEAHGAVVHARDGILDDVAHAVVNLGHGAGEELGEARAARGEAELVLGAILRAAQVGGDEDLGAVLDEVLDGGDGGADAGVVGDLEVLVEGHVEVAAHEHGLALEVSLLEVADGLLLGLNLERGASLGADGGLLGPHGGLGEERAGGEGGGSGER